MGQPWMQVGWKARGEVPGDDLHHLSPRGRSCPSCTKRGTPRTRTASCSTSWSVSQRKRRRPVAGKSRWASVGSCRWRGALVGLGPRIRDVVSAGNHTNPDRKNTENFPFLPKHQAIMQAVLDTAHGLCPAVVQKSGVRDQLVNAMSEQIYLQDHLNLSTVLDQMVTDVFSKLKWVMCRSSLLLGHGVRRGPGESPSTAPLPTGWARAGSWCCIFPAVALASRSDPVQMCP